GLIVGITGPLSPQGVDTLDASVSAGYIIGTDAAAFGSLIVRRVSSPGSLSPSISSNIAVTGVPTTSSPLSVPQTGTATGLDPVDDRLFNATIRNGHLWTAHNIATGR